MLYDDSVRVPADAAPGPATLRIELKSDRHAAVATEVPAVVR